LETEKFRKVRQAVGFFLFTSHLAYLQWNEKKARNKPIKEEKRKEQTASRKRLTILFFVFFSFTIKLQWVWRKRELNCKWKRTKAQRTNEGKQKNKEEKKACFIPFHYLSFLFGLFFSLHFFPFNSRLHSFSRSFRSSISLKLNGNKQVLVLFLFGSFLFPLHLCFN